MKICFISPFPPRHDGISEFNQDLIHGLEKNYTFEYIGIAINQNNEVIKYDKHIIFQIRKDQLEDYLQAAVMVNQSDANIICLQLEYALFGGFDGKYIFDLIRGLKKKLIIIVHGIPINSYSRRKKTRKKFFQKISPYVEAFITINPLEKKILEGWGINNKIYNIFHGAPDEILNYHKSASRTALKIKDELIVFNFGLIHEKKGLEYLLIAFNEFSKKNTLAKLIIAGESLLGAKNNDYLSSLMQYVKKEHLTNQVTFINKFLQHDELYTYIASADIIVFPYIKRDLVSSGPLSFAILADKFIITTNFPYARVLLNKDQAYFVHYKNALDIKRGLEFYVDNRDTKIKNMLNGLKNRAGVIAWSMISQQYYRVLVNILKSND